METRAKAALLRELADRTRRLAATLSTDEARREVERYADELEAEAAELEQRAPTEQ